MSWHELLIILLSRLSLLYSFFLGDRDSMKVSLSVLEYISKSSLLEESLQLFMLCYTKPRISSSEDTFKY